MRSQGDTLPKPVMESTSLGQLGRRFLLTPEIVVYFGLMFAALAAAIATYKTPWLTFAPVATIILFYPALEYILHRYILHCLAFSRFPIMIAAWYRLHYGHHSDPKDTHIVLAQPISILSVALGATTLIGAAYGDWSSFASALTVSLGAVILYEFVHCMAHVPFLARQAPLRALQMHHRLHHFHNERGNFGIAFMIVDRLVGTRYLSSVDRPRSATVNNLGYAGDIVRKFPQLAEYAQRQQH